MMKRYIIAVLCIFLTGCSSHQIEYKTTASEELEAAATMGENLNNDSTTDIQPDNYSGEWISWNNADSESEGGVSLTATISGQFIDAKLSAWSSNYNRLADTEISGLIQDNKVKCHFDDDGRGHDGEVQLTLENNIIRMEIILDKASANGDFTFPEGTIILQRKNTPNTTIQSE